MSDERYRALLETLHDTLQGNSEKTIEVSDERLNTTIVSQSKEQDKEYIHRNELYTQLLEMYIFNYNKKEKVKGIYKLIFFIVTIALFVGIVTCGLIGIVKLSIYSNNNLANVGIAIANIAGIISALMILPKIIEEHLFPTNEESNMLKMVRNMQDNDTNIRNTFYDGRNDNE